MLSSRQVGGDRVSATTRRMSIRRALGSVSWATTAQVLSAASNFVVTIAVARGTGLEGLGRFSIAFAAYLTVLGFSRSLISEPLLARRGPGDGREAEAASVTLTLLFSLAGAAVVGGTGLALGRLELVVAGAALPVTLLHDLLRYHAFGRERPELAARLDGGWLLGSLLLWPVLTNSSSAAVAVLCWAGAAVLGIALGWAPLLPRLLGARAAFRWWRRHARGLAGPLVLDSLLVTMALQTTVVIITAVSGDSALGLLRAGQV